MEHAPWEPEPLRGRDLCAKYDLADFSAVQNHLDLVDLLRKAVNDQLERPCRLRQIPRREGERRRLRVDGFTEEVLPLAVLQRHVPRPVLSLERERETARKSGATLRPCSDDGDAEAAGCTADEPIGACIRRGRVEALAVEFERAATDANWHLFTVCVKMQTARRREVRSGLHEPRARDAVPAV